MNKNYLFYLDEETIQILEKLAEEYKTTRSGIIRMLVAGKIKIKEE